MFCEKCGKELRESMQCDCDSLNKPHDNFRESKDVYLVWIYILASIWWVAVQGVIVKIDLPAFALLGLKLWLKSGGWITIIVYCGFVVLIEYLKYICEKLGHRERILKRLSNKNRRTITKAEEIILKIIDFYIIVQILIGIVGFYRETGTVFSRWILVNIHVYAACKASVLCSAFEIFAFLFPIPEKKQKTFS